VCPRDPRARERLLPPPASSSPLLMPS
jgi:hypothetical protein